MRIHKNTLVKFGFILFFILVPLVTSSIAPYSNHIELQTAVTSVNNGVNLSPAYHPDFNYTKFVMDLSIQIEVWNPTKSLKIIKVEKNEDNCFESPFNLEISKYSYVKKDTLFDQLDLPENLKDECIYDQWVKVQKFRFERGITYIRTEYYNEFFLPGNVTVLFGEIVFRFILNGLLTTKYDGSLYIANEFYSYFKISSKFPQDVWGSVTTSIYTIIIGIEIILILFYLYKKKNKILEYMALN